MGYEGRGDDSGAIGAAALNLRNLLGPAG